jgi:glycerophosphoryl diester phosphodiesterase
MPSEPALKSDCVPNHRTTASPAAAAWTRPSALGSSGLRRGLAVVVLAALSGCGGDSDDDAADPADASANADVADAGGDDGGLVADADAAIDAEDGSAAPDAVTLPPRPSAWDCLADPACDRVLVVAHRGEHGEVPENSIAAIERTAAAGISLAEIDVRETADGVLVLMHDGTVDRTTDGTGNVSDFTFAELQALTLVGGTPGDEATARIPTFEDALALARETGIALYVDIKTSRLDLIVEAVHAGGYEDVALLRDDLDSLIPWAGETPALWFLPAVESAADAERALAAFDGLQIVELASPAIDPERTGAIRALGLRVQQDVIVGGDLQGSLGDPSGWIAYLEAGVRMPQSDVPIPLLQAVEAWELEQARP